MKEALLMKTSNTYPLMYNSMTGLHWFSIPTTDWHKSGPYYYNAEVVPIRDDGTSIAISALDNMNQFDGKVFKLIMKQAGAYNNKQLRSAARGSTKEATEMIECEIKVNEALDSLYAKNSGGQSRERTKIRNSIAKIATLRVVHTKELRGRTVSTSVPLFSTVTEHSFRGAWSKISLRVSSEFVEAISKKGIKYEGTSSHREKESLRWSPVGDLRLSGQLNAAFDYLYVGGRNGIEPRVKFNVSDIMYSLNLTTLNQVLMLMKKVNKELKLHYKKEGEEYILADN